MPVDFSKAFVGGYQFHSPAGDQELELNATIEQKEIGSLSILTGQIVACDPFSLLFEEDIIGFNLPVKPLQASLFEDQDSPSRPAHIQPGRYPVVLSVARVQAVSSGKSFIYEQNACVMLKFTDTMPVIWQMATLPGQDVNTLTNHEFLVMV